MPTTFDPRNFGPTRAFEEGKAFGLTEQHLRKLWGEIIGSARNNIDLWIESGVAPKKILEEIPPLPQLKIEKISRSLVDGFKKILFRTTDDLAIEAVIIPLKKKGCVTVCLSSQVGCVMGCVFCATAKIKKRRNLKTWEIVDQYVQCRKLAKEDGSTVTGVVFMGMGEPFLNYESVISAAQLFSFPTKNAISGRAITISTVGLVKEIERFTNEDHPFRLSISLGAATDEKRADLLPVASRTKVHDVMMAARKYAIKKNDRVNIAYVCIGGVNTFKEDAIALGNLIGDTQVRLDLIDVCDPSGKYSPPTPQELNTFRDALNVYLKQPVARRYSGGSDINAGCGMLAGA